MRFTNRGVIYAVVGEKYLREARTSVRSLRAVHPDLPVLVLTVDTEDVFNSIFGDIPGAHRRDCNADLASLGIDLSNPHEASRALKVSVVDLSPFDYSLFLDSDTFVRLPIDEIFACMADAEHASALIVTNEPKAVHVFQPGANRPVATTLSALSDPKNFNSGVFAFSRELRNTEFGQAWQKTWLDQSRSDSSHEWARLSDQRALNKTIQERRPEYSIIPNTIWNAQCKILRTLIERNQWEDIAIIHCKLVHSHGCDPRILEKQPYIARYSLI